jgi:hypothetical protein
MPIRAFVSQNIEQLKATLASLEKATASGSLEEIRVSGITTRTNKLTTQDVARAYLQCRYELYLRVTALADSDANKAALVAQYGTNPYQERVMRVETIQGCNPLGGWV